MKTRRIIQNSLWSLTLIVVFMFVASSTQAQITYGTKITLKSAHGKYLVSEHSGALNANRTAARSLETFTIINAANPSSVATVKFGDKIFLKSSLGKYVVAEHNGTANVNRNRAASLETFYILNPANLNARGTIYQKRDKVCFKSLHAKFIVAEHDGKVNANRTRAASLETWSMRKRVMPKKVTRITYGSQISLKSYHGKYLVSEHSGALNANRTAARSLERFTIINANNPSSRGYVKFGDKIFLKSSLGKYVVAEHNGTANANRNRAASLETFYIKNPKNIGSVATVNFAEEKVAFLSLHKKYLVAESNGKVNANRKAAGPWETWKIFKR